MSTHTQAQIKAPSISKSTFTPIPSGLLQRKCTCGGTPGMDGECEECRQKRLSLQRRATNQAEPATVPPIVHDVLRSPGQPLDAQTRAFMEPRFGHDFSQVRVHTNARAGESATAVNALAYTVGRNVVFGTGQYAPGTMEGRRLLAHELTHVVQQKSSQTVVPQAKLEVNRSGDVSEKEANEVSSQVISSAQPPMQRHFITPSSLLQRKETRTSSNPPLASVDPSIANVPWERYVDIFDKVVYDLDYRHEGGSLSKWLKVYYLDGTIIDINIDDIVGQSMTSVEARNAMAQGHIGIGGRIFPQNMNSSTTPRLWKAKQDAIEIMEESNIAFMQLALPAVMFVITVSMSTIGGPEAAGESSLKSNRSRVSRQTGGSPPSVKGEGEAPPPPTTKGSGGGGGRASAKPQIKTTGKTTPGNVGSQRASAESLAEREAAQSARTQLPTNQQVIRDTLMNEHPGLNIDVATDAAKGGERAMGPGGAGGDVKLVVGGAREVSVHTGEFTSGSVGGHLQTEALQAGTREVYLQINSAGATREGAIQMMSGLRNAYPELRGIFVKIFGPDGKVWWSGTMSGP